MRRADAVCRGRVNCSRVLVGWEQKLRLMRGLNLTLGVFLISTFALDLHIRLRIRFWAMSGMGPLPQWGRLRLHTR